MDKFFKNVVFHSMPENFEITLFSCDEIYFEKYGIYNLISLGKLNESVHVHLINPSTESINKIETLKEKFKFLVTYSCEYLDTKNLNFFYIKSYYYMSRFYISNYIFEKTKAKSIKIVDCDLIFNKSVSFLENVKIAIHYKPNKKTPWERTSAYFIFLTADSRKLLLNLINLYENKIKNINFSEIEKIQDKITKANFTGLDQVCLTEIIEKEEIHKNSNFLNLELIENFSGKGENSNIWVIVGKTKRMLPDNYLSLKYKDYIEKIL